MPENRDIEERRNEFVEAAERLFRENGIVDTTIASIVKEMDVAKGLFYYYFKSKDDVIDAISDKYNRIFNEMMNVAMDQNDFDARMKQFVDNSVASFREMRQKLQGNDEAVDLSLLSMRSIQEAKNAAVEKMTALLKEGNDGGSLQVDDPSSYARFFISGIVGLIEQDDVEDAVIRNIVMGLIEKTGKEY